MKPKLLFIVNTYAPGAIPKILNLLIPTFLNIYKIKIISLDKMDNFYALSELNKDVEFKALEMHRLNILGTLIKLRKEINSYSPDIIHSHLGRAYIYSAICKIANSKLIATIHTIRKIQFKRGLFNITQILFKLLENRFDYKVFISKIVQASWIRNNIESRKAVIYNPVKIKKRTYEKMHIDQPFKILFAGRLLDFKNTILIVKSIKEIVRIDTNIQLIVAGDGPEFHNIDNYIRNNKLESNISMLGFCNEMDSIYSQADLIVFPSLWSSGLPMVAIEASQFNTALLSSDIIGVQEFIQNNKNGLLFKSDSYFDLAEKILVLKNDPIHREMLASNLKSYVDKNFSTEKCADKYLNIYKRLLVKTL